MKHSGRRVFKHSRPSHGSRVCQVSNLDHVTLAHPEPPNTGWWNRYLESLTDSGMTSTSLDVLAADCRYILKNGILGSADPTNDAETATRHRSGLVMGAVQSGKTASMLGITAMALDAKIDIVILLSGTRVALWRQTFDRLVKQLNPSSRDHLFPCPALIEDGNSRISDWYQMHSARARRALNDQEPIVMVVMKHGQHLSAVARMLHDRIYPQITNLNRDIRLLILDDEADDGSILDANVENELDPAWDVLKQIPRHIVDLWSRREEAPATANARLFSTYVAYTATPQANFLQTDVNPLAPNDFVAALRTPFETGEVEPRSTNYREPAGLSRYYTGGETFYRKLSASLMVTEEDSNRSPTTTRSHDLDGAPDSEDSEPDSDSRRSWIGAATRAYLIAGAIRLMRDPHGRRLHGLQEIAFPSSAQVRAACPKPHTMLFHPSASVEDQFTAKAELLAWAHDVNFEEAMTLAAAGCRTLSVDALAADMDTDPARWTHWIESYRMSARAVAGEFNLASSPLIPNTMEAWSELRNFLLTEVIPFVEISVVNSDAAADDRPQFDPYKVGESWYAPRDLLTIFISGNVMARGLTLEGLTTTLFLRHANDPAADTQMQMQRWFGYRGEFIDLCRIFLPQRQAELFAQYDRNDEALRREIIDAMNCSPDQAPTPLVLEGEAFRSTGKLAGVTKLPLSPGAHPFVRLLNPADAPDPNTGLLAEIFDAPSVDVIAAGTIRGRILLNPLPLTQTAELLDRLTYVDYTPDARDQSITRWRSLEGQLGLRDDVDTSLLSLFRGPQGEPQQWARGDVCPYQIAAYLRLWAAALDRRAVGLFPTDDGDVPWSALDLETRRAEQPSFYIGWRYGSVQLSRDEIRRAGFGDLPFTPLAMDRAVNGRRLSGTWGSRNPGNAPDSYAGDQLFDYHHHGLTPVPISEEATISWRPRGAPGLVLFHLIRESPNCVPRVAVGVAVPLGGPDHFASRSQITRMNT